MTDYDTEQLDSQLVPLATAQEYARKAFEKGKAVGEATVLKGLKTVAALNGSGRQVLEWAEEGEVLLDSLDPVSKAVTFREEEHPRDKNGQFMGAGRVMEAARAASKGDHGPADKLRAEVAPEWLDKLNEHLARPDRADPTARTGGVRNQRDVGHEKGAAAKMWLTGAVHAIRHTGQYDHLEIRSAITRATSGTTPMLKKVLLALDPETLSSHQPATKEGLQNRIDELMTNAIAAAKREHLTQQMFVKEEQQKHEATLREHTSSALHDAKEKLHRYREWHRIAHDEHSTAAVRETEELVAKLTAMKAGHELPSRHEAGPEIARLLGHDQGPVIPTPSPVPWETRKALRKAKRKARVRKSKDATGHEHKDKGPGGGQFTSGGEGGGGGGSSGPPGKPDGDAAPDSKTAGHASPLQSADPLEHAEAAYTKAGAANVSADEAEVHQAAMGGKLEEAIAEHAEQHEQQVATIREHLHHAGASDEELAAFDKAADKDRQALKKSADRVSTAHERYAARKAEFDAATADADEEDPTYPEEPDDEDEPPEPEEPTEPDVTFDVSAGPPDWEADGYTDRDEFEKDVATFAADVKATEEHTAAMKEYEAAHKDWEKASKEVEKRNEKKNKEYEKKTADYDRKFDQVTARNERRQERRDRSEEKAESAEAAYDTARYEYQSHTTGDAFDAIYAVVDKLSEKIGERLEGGEVEDEDEEEEEAPHRQHA